MAKKKISDDGYVPVNVRVQVSIHPAFRIVIDEPAWAGHSWYGDTAIDALRRMRKSVQGKKAVIDGKVRQEFGEVSVRTSDSALVAATGWKEATFDTNDYASAHNEHGHDTRPDERVVG